MAYMRGRNYIWRDEDGVHFWSATGNDYWFEAGWHDYSDNDDEKIINPDHLDSEGNVTASGVYIETEPIDEFVVMRIAELLEKSTLASAIDRAIARNSQGWGESEPTIEHFRVRQLKELLRKLNLSEEH